MSTTKEVQATKPTKRISLQNSFEDKNFAVEATIDYNEKAIQLTLKGTAFAIMGKVSEAFKYGFRPDGSATLNFKRDGIDNDPFNNVSLETKVSNGEVMFKELLTFLRSVDLHTPTTSISDAFSGLLEAVGKQLKICENGRYAEVGALSLEHVRWIIEKNKMDSVGNLDAIPFSEYLDGKVILRKEAMNS